MDILNWIFLRKEELIRTKANDPDTDLIALGADVGFNKRGDKYQTYAMPLKDAVQSGLVANTAYYTVDLSVTSVVDVTTPKGVIEIRMDSGNANPAPSFETAESLTITNASLDFSDPDNIFMQHSSYYNPAANDNFIPYVISTGFLAGANYAIFNANGLQQTSINGYTSSGGGTVLAAANTTYSFITGITSGPGQNARFAITRDSLGDVSEVYLIDAGINYAPSDTILISGDLIGGAAGVDDLNITVSSIHGEGQFTGIFYLYYELYNF